MQNVPGILLNLRHLSTSTGVINLKDLRSFTHTQRVLSYHKYHMAKMVAVQHNPSTVCPRSLGPFHMVSYYKNKLGQGFLDILYVLEVMTHSIK